MTITTLTAEAKPTDLMMYDFNIILMDMDEMVGETICKNADDSYTIFVNSKWSAEMQRYCVLHAFDHVRHHDWEKYDVQEIERERHETSSVVCQGQH